MRDLLTEDKISDNALFDLWLKYKVEIVMLSKTSSSQNEYLDYVNRLFEKISNELLSRSQNRPDLTQKIINNTGIDTSEKTQDSRKSLYISAATASNSHANPTTIRRDSSSFWARPKQRLFSDKLKSIHDASILTQMMYIVTQYLHEKTKIDTQNMPDFFQTFAYKASDTIDDADKIAALKTEFKMSDSNTSNVLNVLHLYHDLAAIREGRVSIFYIKNLIERLCNEMQMHKRNRCNRYKALLESLIKAVHSILPNTRKPANDVKFGQGPTLTTR